MCEASYASIPTLPSALPAFQSCDPVSEKLQSSLNESLSPAFCAKWNPDFNQNGRQCCGKSARGPRGKRRGKKSLGPYPTSRGRKNRCDEITDEQKSYIQSVNDGKIGDVLAFLTREMGRSGEQAYCSVNNGFLAHGRPVVPHPQNRLRILAPQRCSHFGTDAMAGMMEWVGREVAKTYQSESTSGSQIFLGDIAGPKGGRVYGPSGRRSHASHTTGQDADVGFFRPRAKLEAMTHFDRTFDSSSNWWMIKKIFKNPFACIKVIFLDRRLIQKLAGVAKTDPDWTHFQRFIRHMAGHKNHMHVRIGNGPGQPGCVPGARPELETEDDDLEKFESDESSLLEDIEELRSRQSPS